MNSPSVKNITTALVLVTLVFVGYYFFSQKDTLTTESQVSQELFADVQKYIARREVLDQITLDTSLLSNPRFTTLTGLPRAIPAQPVSRPNPFDPANSVQTNFTE